MTALYQEKCRCCLEDLNNSQTLLSNDLIKIIESLTSIKLNTSSTLLSTTICKSCQDTFESIQTFSKQIIGTQKLLQDLLGKTENDFKQATVEESNDNCSIESDDAASQSKTKDKTNRTTDDYPDNACPMCGKKFTEKRKIPLHIKRIHVKVKDFHCDQCDYAAYTRFDIVRHKKNIHAPPTEDRGDKRVCPDCGKVVVGNNQLTLHIRKKHLQIKKYYCDHCSFASYGKYEIRSHLEHSHVPKEFKERHSCSMCSSVLSSATGLRVHIQHKHSGLKPHECFCGKSFSLRETLKTHIRNVHKGERKFSCQFCPKRFGQAVRLRDHISNNHGQKQEIPCKFLNCTKVFHSSRNLKAHEIYHYPPKFDCKHCGKKFFLSNKLKEHLKVHEGMDHVCKVCSRSFQLLSSLKRHMKNHSQSMSENNNFEVKESPRP